MMPYTKAYRMTDRVRYNSIHQDNIKELVENFYPKVLKDPIISPFFIQKLGDNIESTQWKTHLKLITEFWKFVALGFDEYKGNPLKPHLEMQGISREAFANWIKLFHETVDERFDETAGSYLKDKSAEIAENFMRKLNL